ncbi:hypothetical protein HCN51_30980 [Nonomuraea sp. FMUSA5-5]|uniref:Lipoprotein n=1 Tax=Nonomuraea composti TaxID=2720023 RepID=A0ABX1BES2_9ACTN|nr:hypothetical protein [Nonomuraea sp. FMUSA5-5]NJP93816.1 hypothetical protein [Nonomuraea sp. FMUSA5-5]
MRIIPAALLVMLMAACGSVPGRSVAVGGDDFDQRARQLAERWQASPERGPWTDGFVPLRNLTLEMDWAHVPRWVGRSLINTAWKLETELPAQTPAPAELRFADGGTMSVPALTARAAYAGLTKPKSFADEPCPARGCRPLRVIGARLGQATVPSSRGEVRVPVWEFTVKDVPQPLRRVAVDPAVMGGPPRPLHDDVQEVRTYDTPRPAELRLSYLHGTCDTTYGARVHESAQAVVVDVDVREDHVEFCNAMGKTDHIAVTLERPLGRRVVLDYSSGLPLLPDSDIHLAEFRNYDPRRS